MAYYRTLYTILSGDAAGRNDDITSEDVVCRRIYNVELVYNVVLYVVPLASLVRDFSHAL